MMGPDLSAIRNKLKGSDDADIEDMLAYKRHEYIPEVIQSAEEELSARGYSPAAIEALQHRQETESLEREAFLNRALATIRELDARTGGCHLCSQSSQPVEIEFGLAAVETGRPEVHPAFVALSVLTVPLLGAGILMRKQMVKARVIPLHLRLCAACAKRKRWLGTWNLAEEDYRRHPAWSLAVSLGFDRFICPDSLKRGSTRRT